MSRQLYLLTSPELHSTGHYFHHAARRAGLSVLLDTEGRMPRELEAEDMLLYVDPGPESFPLGIERQRALRVAYLIDVHQDIQSRIDLAPLFDVVFVAQRDYVSRFSDLGHRAYWLPLACDPQIHFSPGASRDLEVAFVGKLGFPGTSRREVLEAVLARFPANDHRSFQSPEEMGKIYSRARIVINASINGDLNMRVFEAMAAGAMLVTDRIANGLDELFVEDRHYVGYSGVDEAVAKVRYYLENEAQRGRIAASGQALALSAHTYDHRWAQLDAVSRSTVPLGSKRLSRADARSIYGKIFEARRDPAGLWRLGRSAGMSLQLGMRMIRAIARAVNARIPITPNAIRARVRAIQFGRTRSDDA